MRALITGASGGIGEAIAQALAPTSTGLLLTGRSAEKLERVAERVKERTSAVETFPADLTDDDQVRALAACAEASGGVDVLVHSIGLFLAGPLETTPVEALDRQLRVNLHVPYLLTQILLPSLLARQGQVVFINSSAGHHPGRGGWGAYAASKHGLRALADSLREEVNKRGVRVITIFPGRTATPMQAEVHRFEGKPYDPERFLTPEDVAATVLAAVSLPRTAEVTDLHVRPMRG